MISNRNVQTLVFCVLLYVVICFFVLITPHAPDGFGKMNAHQVFANIGKYLTFGLLDLTLTDWYMVPGDFKANTIWYDRIVNKSIVNLSIVYIFWFWLLATITRKLISKKA